MSDEIIRWGGAVLSAAIGYALAGLNGAVFLGFIWTTCTDPTI